MNTNKIVVIPSFSKVGTLSTEGVSRAAYSRATLNERAEMAHIEGAELMALNFYEDPILTAGSNEGEMRLVGWRRDWCQPCDANSVLGVLSEQLGEKTVVATVHTCAFLRGIGYVRGFEAWGSIKVDPPVRAASSLQLEALEVFRKIQQITIVRQPNEGLWQLIVDDLTKLLMQVRAAATYASSRDSSSERESVPHGGETTWMSNLAPAVENVPAAHHLFRPAVAVSLVGQCSRDADWLKAALAQWSLKSAPLSFVERQGAPQSQSLPTFVSSELEEALLQPEDPVEQQVMQVDEAELALNDLMRIVPGWKGKVLYYCCRAAFFAGVGWARAWERIRSQPAWFWGALAAGTLQTIGIHLGLRLGQFLRERWAQPQMERVPGFRTINNLREAVDRAPVVMDSITASAAELERVGFNLNQILASVQQWTNAPMSSLVSSELFCLFLDLIRECLQTHPLGITTLAIRFCKTFNVFSHEKTVVTMLTKVWSYYTTSAPMTQLDQIGMDERLANPNGPGEILAALVALIGLAVTRGAYNEKAALRVQEALRAVNLCVPAGRNLAALMSGVSSVLPPAVGAWFEELCPEQLWLQAIKEAEVEEWMASTEKLCVESNKLLLVHDAEMQYQLSLVKKQGEVISSKLACLAKCAPGMYNRILRRLELVDEFVRHLACVSGLIDNKRPVPFCVYLYGEAGIGKSVASEVIVEALVPPEIPKRMRVYSRVPGSDYFDGYLCQWAVVMDDFAQSSDGEDALELIRMVNSTTYLPPMASLDNAAVGVKATPFTSKLLVLTSNSGYPTSNRITKQQAAWRRRHFLLECKVKPEYAVGGVLDMMRVPNEVAARLGHIEWIRHDPLNHRTVGKPLETLEMLCELRAAYRMHEERNNFLMQGGLFSGLLADVAALEEARKATPQMETTISTTRKRHTFYAQSAEAVAAAAQDLRDKEGEPTDIEFFSAQGSSVLEEPQPDEIRVLDRAGWTELFRQPLVRKSMAKLSAGSQSIQEGYKCLQQGVEAFLREHPWLATCVASAGIAAAIFGAIAFAWGGSHAITGVPNMANPSPGDQKHEAVGVRFAKRTASTRRGQANMESMQVFPSAVGDPEGAKIVELLASNMVYMRVHNPVDDTAFGMGAFVLRGRTAILPMHFFKPCGDLVEDGRQMSVLWKGKETTFLFQRKNLYAFPKTDEQGRERDLAFYELPVTVAPFKDRTSQVAPDDYLERMHRKQGYMLSMRGGRLSVTMLPDLKVSTITTAYTIGSTRFATPVTLEYTAATQVGDCGALILVADPSVQARIVGIHVASYKNFGLADFLTSVELQTVDEKLPAQGDRSPVVPQFCREGESGRFQPRGKFTIMGKVPRQCASRMADSTHIRESVIFDEVFQHETEPAVLRPDDPRLDDEHKGMSIILKAIEKYGNPSGPFDERVLDEVLEFYKDMINSPDTPYPRRVLTLDEAINGIPGLAYMDGLCMKSSAGFGFRLPGQPGKAHLFQQDENGKYFLKLDGMGRQLSLSLIEREAQAREGNRVASIWTDSLKDERRPLKKIACGKTRAFCIPQVDYSILVRKYFLAFCAHFYSLHKSSFSAVGCDPESSDWDIFARQLLGVSDKLFDADFENFDGRASAEVMRRVLDLVNAFYDDGPENARVREVLIEEMIHTVALCGDTLYIKHGGMPSGSPLTVVFNTLINMFYMYYCYLLLVPKPLADASVFRRCVAFKIYGDDNVAAVSSGMLPYFNAKNIAEVLLEHGIVITPASKDGAFVDSMSIAEITFLKRAFAIVPEVHPLMFIPQMSDRTIQELTNWIHDNGDPLEMTLVNCETALRFAMFRGRAYFEDTRARIVTALQRRDPSPVFLPHFSQLVRLFNEVHGGRLLPPSNEDILLAQSQLGERLACPQMMRELGSASMFGQPAKIDQQGVTMTTQEGLVVQAKDGARNPRLAPSFDSILEHPWSIKTIAERENFLNQVAWTSSDSYGSPLLSFQLPDLSTFPDSPFLRLFRQFTYYRGEWVFTFQLNGTRFHQGSLIAYWTPLTRAETTSMKFDKVHSTSMQHVMLNASTSTTAQLRIPFVHGQAYLPTTPTNEKETLGRLMLQVFNGLEFATGASTSLWVSVSYHVENLEVYLPRVVNSTGFVAERSAKPNAEIIPLAPTQEQEKEEVPAIGPEMFAPRRKLNQKGEEMYLSLRDVCKRRVPLFTAPIIAFNVNTSTPYYNKCYPGFVAFDAGILLNRAFSNNVVNDISNMYGLSRGSFKFTMEFADSTPTDQTYPATVNRVAPVGDRRYFAYFLPLVATNPTNLVTAWNDNPFEFCSYWSPTLLSLLAHSNCPNKIDLDTGATGSLRRLAWRLMNLVPLPTWEIPGTSGIYASFRAGARGPTAIAYSSSPVLNLEIPYSSLYNAYTNYGVPVSQQTPDGGFSSPGIVVVGCTGVPNTPLSADSVPLSTAIDFVNAITQCTVSVYGSYGDATRSGVFHAVPKVYVNPIQSMVSEDNNYYSIGFDERTAVPQGNQVSVWHNKIYHQFGNVGSAVLPTNITGDKFDTKQEAKMAMPLPGMDKPSWTLNGEPYLRQPAPYLSHAQNIEPTDVMALYPATNVECEPAHFGCVEDEMAIDYLCQKMTYLGTFTWTTASTVDTRLWDNTVGLLNPVTTGVLNEIAPANKVALPLVDVVASMFVKYTGTLRYRFQFVCSGFHTGRIWIAVNYTSTYPQAQSPPSSIVEATNQYGMMVDVGPNMQDITLDVPYKAPVEWSLIGTKNNTSYGIANISVWVINQLVAPEGVPTSIEVNVFKGAGSDFQLNELGGPNNGVSLRFGDDPV